MRLTAAAISKKNYVATALWFRVDCQMITLPSSLRGQDFLSQLKETLKSQSYPYIERAPADIAEDVIAHARFVIEAALIDEAPTVPGADAPLWSFGVA